MLLSSALLLGIFVAKLWFIRHWDEFALFRLGFVFRPRTTSLGIKPLVFLGPVYWVRNVSFPFRLLARFV